MQQRIKKRQKIQDDLEINNWLVAVVLSFFLINGVIGVDGVSYFTLMVILILCIISIKRKKFIIYPSAMILIGVVLALFFVSLFRVRDTTYTFFYFQYFGGFCIVSFLAGLQNICVEKVIAHMAPIGSVGMIVVLIRGFSSLDGPLLMGLSYAILPFLLSSVIGLYLDRKTRLLSIANIIMVLWCFVQVAPRGIWVVVACFIAIYGLYILCKSKYVSSRMMKEVLLISFSFVVIVSVIANFTEIVLGINDFLSSKYDVKIYALEKYAYYLKEGNLLNGRGEIWMDALKFIRENPLFGKGIGYFEIQNGAYAGAYVHDIFLQAMCEGGIIFLIPVVLLVLVSLITLLKVPDKDGRNEYLFFALTFSYGVVMLFYSSVHWKFIPFWFYLGYFFKRVIVNKQSIKMRMEI